MDLQLHQRENEGIRILDLRGHLIIGDSEATLRTAIVALAEPRAVTVLLNFAGVTEIDDDGLGALVFCYARIVRATTMFSILSRSKRKVQHPIFRSEQRARDFVQDSIRVVTNISLSTTSLKTLDYWVV
jgi:anti-anti-sigma regulatory factor